MSGQQPRNQAARRPRAHVRFYFDADVLGLAKVVAALREDVTYPGEPGKTIHGRYRPPCPVTTPNTPDLDWIPVVASQGWAIITRDKAIQRRPAERQAIIDHNARMFTITSKGKLSTWGQLEVLMSRWRQIDRLSTEPGPYIYTVTYSGIQQLAP